MCRLLLPLLAVLALASPASAARVWSEPDPIDPAQATYATAAVAPDGTTITAGQMTDGNLLVRVDDRPAVALGQAWYRRVLVAAGNDGEAVVAWSARSQGSERVRIAVASAGGGLSSPVDVGPGIPARLAMNAAGDAALLIHKGANEPPLFDAGPVANAALFRAAGGTFGPIAAIPDSGIADLAIDASGTTYIGVAKRTDTTGTATGLDVRVRERGGQVGAATTLTADGLAPRLAAAGDNRAIAAWMSPDRMSIMTAVRSAGGAWGPDLPTLAPEGVTGFDLDTSEGGDAVLAWNGYVNPVSGGGEPVLRVATGSLTTGLFAPSTVRAVESAGFEGPSVETAADGTTAVLYVDGTYGEVRVVARDDTKAFEPSEPAACLPIGAAPPAIAGIRSTGSIALVVGTALVRSSANGAVSSLDCERPRGYPGVEQTPAVALPKSPVTIDAMGLQRYKHMAVSYAFDFEDPLVADQRATAASVVERTFPKPGMYPVTITSVQERADDGRRATFRDTFSVAIYRQARMRAQRRQPRSRVLARGVAVSANAFAAGPGQPVVFTLLRKGKRLGRLKEELGPATRLVEIPLNEDATYRVARGRLTRITVRMVQATDDQTITRRATVRVIDEFPGSREIARAKRNGVARVVRR